MGPGDELLEQLDPPDERYERAAQNLIQSKGKNRRQALLKAGFPESIAGHGATKVINSRKFIDALIRLSGTLTDKEVGLLSKGSLINLLGDQQLELRTRIQAIRVGLEVGGLVGNAKELVMRHQIEVPLAAQEMIARRIIELQGAQHERPILPENAISQDQS